MVFGDLGGMGSDVMLGRMVEGSAVMRESAGNARLMGQMMYDRWFSF